MRRRASRLIQRSLDCSRDTKRFIALGADSAVLLAALWGAVSLKADKAVAPSAELLLLGLVALAVALPVFSYTGVYRSVTRYIGFRPLVGAFAGTTLAASAVCGAAWFLPASGMAGSACIVYGVLALLGIFVSRSIVRHAVAAVRGDVDAVVIYGAGAAGARLGAVMAASRDCVPVAYVDDNPALHGSLIHGIEVRPTSELPSLVESHGVSQVLLAMPSATRNRRRQILADLQPLEVQVRTVPDIADILAGNARIEDVRDVDARDLLGRDQVAPVQHLFDACIRGKSVMVTGAGGSIGSELCRQIVRLGPTRIVLLEMSELALYNIDRELRHILGKESLSVEVVPLLGNAHHRHRVQEIMLSYAVQTVYHAAAYKHVPMVEHNIIEGIHNNVIGTWYVAEAALDCKVETFVLVSTDKAVNPTNVMGATKRLAEIVLQGIQRRGSRTRFCMVRFGNVLESSGSVVPLFREQIRQGGPVTVTHPDVIRYFMTIPEAAQLVIQAGSMGKGGDVFVLDMGKPVKIADLARRMINLMGLTVRDERNPDGDIEIKFTGLRPAEKLYEELLIGNNVSGTEHPMIMRAEEHSLPWEEVEDLLNDLLIVMRQYDVHAARELLLKGVREYRPTNGIEDLIWTHRAPRPAAVDTAATGKVATLQERRARIN